MKRILGFSIVLAILTTFGFLESVSSQGNTQELANQHKIIARTRDNQDDRVNENAHPDRAGKPPKRKWHYLSAARNGHVVGVPVVAYYIW
jgi:hypothetical protein